MRGEKDGLSLQSREGAEGRAKEKTPCVVGLTNINKKLPLVKLARNKFPKGEFKAESFSLSLAFPRIHCSVLIDVVMSQKRQSEQLLLRKTFGRYALESGFIDSLPSSPSDSLCRTRVFLIQTSISCLQSQTWMFCFFPVLRCESKLVCK